MSRPPSPWLSVSLALLAALAVAPAFAAPPPQSVCGPCNDGLVSGARGHGLPVGVAESTATVAVHANGSATWTVVSEIVPRDPEDGEFAPNTTLREPAELRSNATLRRAVVRAAVRDSEEYLEPERPNATVQSVSMTNRTLRFTFREPDVARNATGGALLFREYHTRGLGSGWYVDVDRLTIVGPPNTTVGNGVAGAFGPAFERVDGRRLVVTGDPAAPTTVARTDLYVAFVPNDAAPGLRATAAIAAATLPTIIDAFLTMHLPGLVTFVVALASVHVLRTRRHEGLDPRRDAVAGWFGSSVLGYLAVAFALAPPVAPAPMFGPVVAAVLVVVALLAAVVSWVCYPLVGAWFENRLAA